jgi:CDP-paratose 2-epimerase
VSLRADRLGVCEWFHFGDETRLHRTARALRESGLRRVRTGLSWADDFRPTGPDWHATLLDALADFEVLLCLSNTPPSVSRNGRVNGPPHDLDAYAAFAWTVCQRYRGRFEAIELWNEPNNGYYWDFAGHDPQWELFARMTRSAAWVCREQNVPCIMGGIAPADEHFVRRLGDLGALEWVDAIGVHGFPGMWGEGFGQGGGITGIAAGWDDPAGWHGWGERVDRIQRAGDRPVWVTETGSSTWDTPAGRPGRYDEQVRRLEEAATCPADRVYWYAWQDLHPDRPAVEGLHVDEHEYHFGLIDAAGHEKPALATLRRLLDPRST